MGVDQYIDIRQQHPGLPTLLPPPALIILDVERSWLIQIYAGNGTYPPHRDQPEWRRGRRPRAF